MRDNKMGRNNLNPKDRKKEKQLRSRKSRRKARHENKCTDNKAYGDNNNE